MKSIKALSDENQQLLAKVRGVLTDIDDTVSSHGKLQDDAYAALWDLKRAGFKVIPVTGRPAGWCDHIARFWPVDAVVGENGGFYFRHDGEKLHRRFLYNDIERAEFRQRLESIRERIMKEVPGCAIASDQPYREYDVAIDFCEDVPALPQKDVVRIQEIFIEEGAHAKISSIHVNGWFGEFDKLSTTMLCVKEVFGVDLEKEPESFIFCGDSPNDEPMFRFFPLSFAMANIKDYLEIIEHKPAFITNQPGGEGFREVANLLLATR
jgi:HAD superfamily hydrolase (TIGR01484 family)